MTTDKLAGMAPIVKKISRISASEIWQPYAVITYGLDNFPTATSRTDGEHTAEVELTADLIAMTTDSVTLLETLTELVHGTDDSAEHTAVVSKKPRLCTDDFSTFTLDTV